MIGPIHFIDNKYRRWYLEIIDRAKNRFNEFRGEWHHQYPRAFGGLNACCVKLTFQEHFLCHWLLVKFTEGQPKKKMGYTLNQMTRSNKKNNRIVSSWQYEIGKRAQAIAMIGNTHTIGQKRDDAFKAHRREIMMGNTNTKGYKVSDETKRKISKSLLGNQRNVGKKMSAAAKENMRVAQLGRFHSENTKLKMGVSAQGLKKGNSSSRYSGVCWIKRLNKWQSQFKLKDNKYNIYFSNEIDAAICYNYHSAFLIESPKRLNSIPPNAYIHD